MSRPDRLDENVAALLDVRPSDLITQLQAPARRKPTAAWLWVLVPFAAAGAAGVQLNRSPEPPPALQTRAQYSQVSQPRVSQQQAPLEQQLEAPPPAYRAMFVRAPQEASPTQHRPRPRNFPAAIIDPRGPYASSLNAQAMAKLGRHTGEPIAHESAEIRSPTPQVPPTELSSAPVAGQSVSADAPPAPTTWSEPLSESADPGNTNRR
jgi:hypothetical protein